MESNTKNYQLNPYQDSDHYQNKEKEKYNYFIENKAIFGAYPTQTDINHLETLGVRYFLDLTVNFERGTGKYSTRYNYENYPISDRGTPDDTISFAKLIVKYCDIIFGLKMNELVYIHCRGGHGRSGMLSTCILIFLYKINPARAINMITEFHSKRPNLSTRWKRDDKNGKNIEPFIRSQKMFIHYFFKPIYMFMIPKKDLPTKCLYEFCRDIIYGRMYMGGNTRNRILSLFENEKNLNNINDLLSTGLKTIIFNYSNVGKEISKILMDIRLDFLREK